MELGKSETLGIENDHDGGVGHVDTHLDDGGGHKNLCLATDKLTHLLLLVGRFHLAVNLAQAKFWEHLFKHFEAIFKVFKVYLLALFYEWEDDIHLTSLVNLFADAVVERG